MEARIGMIDVTSFGLNSTSRDQREHIHGIKLKEERNSM